MTFSPFAFDVSSLCLFNKIRLSIFHQKVHLIRKLAHYNNTCLSTEVVRFASLFFFSFFLSVVFFSFSQRTTEAEVVQVEPQRMCGKKSKEDDKRNEKSVNPKIESAAHSHGPHEPHHRFVVGCCCCKKTISKQREIGSRMSRTSFSFSIKKENKNIEFFFPSTCAREIRT